MGHIDDRIAGLRAENEQFREEVIRLQRQSSNLYTENKSNKQANIFYHKERERLQAENARLKADVNEAKENFE